MAKDQKVFGIRAVYEAIAAGKEIRITSYNVCYTKLLRILQKSSVEILVQEQQIFYLKTKFRWSLLIILVPLVKSWIN